MCLHDAATRCCIATTGGKHRRRCAPGARCVGTATCTCVHHAARSVVPMPGCSPQRAKLPEFPVPLPRNHLPRTPQASLDLYANNFESAEERLPTLLALVDSFRKRVSEDLQQARDVSHSALLCRCRYMSLCLWWCNGITLVAPIAAATVSNRACALQHTHSCHLDDCECLPCRCWSAAP